MGGFPEKDVAVGGGWAAPPALAGANHLWLLEEDFVLRK